MAKTLKVLAKELNCSYEAVRKQVKRYRTELADHIHTEHKTQYLDDYACDFLRSKRQESPVVVSRIEYDEAVELLKGKYTAALEEINQLKDEKHALEEEKRQLEAKTARIALLEAERYKIDQEAREAQKEAQKVVDDLTNAYKEEQKRHEDEEHLLKQRADAADAYAAELAEYVALPFWKRLRTKKPVLKNLELEEEKTKDETIDEI